MAKPLRDGGGSTTKKKDQGKRKKSTDKFKTLRKMKAMEELKLIISIFRSFYLIFQMQKKICLSEFFSVQLT